MTLPYTAPVITMENSSMGFGSALECLKYGQRVARAGWNGKGMWLQLVTNWNGNFAPVGENYSTAPFIVMKTTDPLPTLVPWLASQTDILATDWSVL